MMKVEVSDMGNGRNVFRKPKPSMNEIHPDDRRNRIFCQRPFLIKGYTGGSETQPEIGEGPDGRWGRSKNT